MRFWLLWAHDHLWWIVWGLVITVCAIVLVSRDSGWRCTASTTELELFPQGDGTIVPMYVENCTRWEKIR